MDLSKLDTKFGVGIGIVAVLGSCLFKFLKQKYGIDDDISDDSESDSKSSYNGEEDYKLVFLIRTDLKMSKGKVAAQCAHAAVAAYKSALKHSTMLRHWERNGQPKITLKVDNDTDLLHLTKKAKIAGLLTNLITDAGHTQIKSGSKTVCAIGPGPDKLINSITGHLKLY